MLSDMRAIVLAVWLAGCTISGGGRGLAAPTQPPADTMPSDVLDRQDPGADTSRNPELSRSSSRSLLDDLLGGLSPWRASPPAFSGPTEAPHYYKGCRGCSTEGPGGLAAVAVAVAAGLALRRRDRVTRGRVTQSRSCGPGARR
ncbi:MAG TPA: MYXO-CTERM sorting domain-containing protein [Kofleriaceae bacterium]|nr:MYXO-CTERM sorting domain-containing protein [Kofleriaceae bacterium]